MNYYKLLKDDKIIGVCNESDFRMFQPKNNIILFCSVDDAEYINYKDNLYRDTWMRQLQDDAECEYVLSTVQKIDEGEYNALYEALNTESEIVIPQEPEPEDIVKNRPEDADAALDYVREVKIMEMSRACENTIMYGFDIILTDGKEHHFSMSITDQLNLLAVNYQLINGEQLIPYHADDELCKYYDSDDIYLITEKATLIKTYHTTYFNSLKSYIDSIGDFEEIANIRYGIEIPDEYKSDILKDLERNID